MTLTAGQHAQADFTLARQEFYSVTVTIANHEMGGDEPPGTRPKWPADGLSRAVESEQGTAQVNVPSGSYFIEGRRRGEAQLYGRVEFTVAGAPLTGLNMALLPLHAVPVTVRKVFTATNKSGSRLSSQR